MDQQVVPHLGIERRYVAGLRAACQDKDTMLIFYWCAHLTRRGAETQGYAQSGPYSGRSSASITLAVAKCRIFGAPGPTPWLLHR